MRRFKPMCAGLVASLVLSSPLLAASLTWDADTTDGGPTDGGGTWDVLSTNWWDGTVNTNWTSATPDDAIFGAGGVAGIISLGEPITVGHLTFNAGYLVQSNTLTLSGPSTATVFSNATIRSTLAGASLVKSGPASLTLAAASTFDGGVTISQGTLVLSNALAAGTNVITLGDAGTGTNSVELLLGAHIGFANRIVVSASGSGRVVLTDLATGLPHSTDSGAVTLNRPTTLQTSGTSDHYFNLSGPIDGNVGTLTIDGVAGNGLGGGNNRVYLNGPCTYTGDVVVTATGKLQIRGNSIPDTAKVTVDGVLQNDGAVNETVGGLFGSGEVRAANSGGFSFTVGAGDAGGYFAGRLVTGFSGGNFFKIGAGTQVLANAGSTFNQTAVVSGGVLQLGDGVSNGVVGTAGITDNANVTFNPGSAQTFAQAITGTGSLTKIGPGALTLSAANSYGGATRVAGGTLKIGGSNRLPTNSVLGVANGAALDVAAYQQSVSTLELGADAPDSAVFHVARIGGALGLLTVTNVGGLAFNGTTTVSLSGLLPPVGSTNTVIRYAGASIGAGSLLLSFSSPRHQGYITNNTAASQVEIVITGEDSLRWVGHPTNGWDYAGETNWSVVSSGLPAAFSNSDTVIFDDTASNFVVALHGPVNPGHLTVNAASNYLFQGGPVQAAGNLEVVGTGTTRVETLLACANVLVANGTLIVGDGGTNGLKATGSIVNGGTIVLNRSDSYSIANLISGAGQLVKRGVGALTLSSSNSYSGGTTVSGGTLQMNNANACGTNIILLGDGESGTNALQLVFGVGGEPNDIIVSTNGTGPVTLYGTAKWQSLSRTVTVNRATTFKVFDAGGADWWFGFGAIAGSGSPLSFVAGAAPNQTRNTLGVNTFSGDVIAQQGRLQVNFPASIPATNNLTVNSSADIRLYTGPLVVNSLNGAGNIFSDNGIQSLVVGGRDGSGLFAGVIQPGIRLTKTGLGTLILTASNTFNGGTTISNGTLTVNHTLGTGNVQVAPAGTLAGIGNVGIVTNAGQVAPGDAGIESLTLAAFQSMPGSTVSIELAGATVPGTDHDQLIVTGSAALDGTLNVITNGYAPLDGDTFTVLSAGSITGSFAATNLPPLAPGLYWDVYYLPGNVMLVVTQAPALTGYNLWAQSITNEALRGYDADADGDGYANLLEYSQGTDPTNDTDRARVLLVKTGEVYALKFNFVTSAVDLVYHVEASYALTNNTGWEGIKSNYLGEGWTGDTTVTFTNDGPVLQIFAEDNDPFIPRRGMRLRVERP